MHRPHVEERLPAISPPSAPPGKNSHRVGQGAGAYHIMSAV
ncbi:hypothetical protein [Haliangium sp.]